MTRAFVLALLVVSASAAAARAEGFGELAGGVAVPFISKEWRDRTTPTVKLGERAGVSWQVGGWFHPGLEALVDESVIVPDGHPTELRVRALGGVRLGAALSPDWLLYARGLAGVDYITSRETCDDAPRFALEVGLGLTQRVGHFGSGRWRWGGQINIPVAAGGPGNPECFAVPRVSHDFDFLVVVDTAL